MNTKRATLRYQIGNRSEWHVVARFSSLSALREKNNTSTAGNRKNVPLVPLAPLTAVVGVGT